MLSWDAWLPYRSSISLSVDERGYGRWNRLFSHQTGPKLLDIISHHFDKLFLSIARQANMRGGQPLQGFALFCSLALSSGRCLAVDCEMARSFGSPKVGSPTSPELATRRVSPAKLLAVRSKQQPSSNYLNFIPPMNNEIEGKNHD